MKIFKIPYYEKLFSKKSSENNDAYREGLLKAMVCVFEDIRHLELYPQITGVCYNVAYFQACLDIEKKIIDSLKKEIDKTRESHED